MYIIYAVMWLVSVTPNAACGIAMISVKTKIQCLRQRFYERGYIGDNGLMTAHGIVGKYTLGN